MLEPRNERPSQGCWKLGTILSLMDLLPERRSFAGMRRLRGVAFPDPVDPCQGIVCAECAVVMQLWRLPRRSEQTGCAMAVIKKASTRPEEYAIDIGMVVSRMWLEIEGGVIS